MVLTQAIVAFLPVSFHGSLLAARCRMRPEVLQASRPLSLPFKCLWLLPKIIDAPGLSGSSEHSKSLQATRLCLPDSSGQMALTLEQLGSSRTAFHIL